ncbi:MAG: leucine--tRNA ligase [Ignavibacteria bacterium]|jgi:leucyl-tRNA synthetase|nr:leucine--tRNA ligase [Ignavibacteria bacterium]MCU7502725.1 leucine--tRNA ligase [Ignavibacteria bacterium]MCU7517346.1 leucine--tRNA ligase [Ignavibacteria bacterium]
MRYPFSEVEKKWQSYWEENKIYKTNLSKKERKLYCLVMFIYPSGAKLHCGHWYNYGPTDSWARYKKLKGFNVFEPIGYDAFGLPAENYAIKTGIHPYDSTMKNIEDIRVQLKNMGNMYDWDSELMTCVPEYYRWNQWLFIQLYKKGLAYRKNAPVNWCPSCQTVLANEQVLSDGSCERCGTTVIRKNLTQWFFKITEYAEELLSGLDKINWPEKTKLMQKNWIGKSTGTEVKFKLEGHEDEITVFTTRPDTLFGVTYVVLAPEQPLVDKLTKPEFKEQVEQYRESVKTLSEIDRTSTVKEKTGVPTGSYAINPVNGEKIPIWVADYVLATYGTGCVMAVPGHDERDFEFAKKFSLPIRKVILAPGTKEEDTLNEAYTEIGKLVNSGSFSGMASDKAIDALSDSLEKEGKGKKKTNYRLRDWLISRQRYWGTPIPVIHCEKCGEVLVEEKDLPVELPYNVEFSTSGKSPLTTNPEFMNVTCPKCGGKAQRDPDTMDTFVDSSWYYFRYLDPHTSDKMFNKKLADEWTPVDMYVGGAEHATMHLLYARFIHKFLRDIGMTKSDEPFTHLIHQGTITNQGAKMSKSKGNVVNPDTFINRYGSDVFRLYLMFMGPYEAGGDWSDSGITGVDRFVQRTYDIFQKFQNITLNSPAPDKFNTQELSEEEKNVYRKINQTISKYDEEIDNFRFNTAVAAMMELVNELSKNLEKSRPALQSYVLERFSCLLAPVAPHLGEECWHMLGKKDSVFSRANWYAPDSDALAVDKVTIAVQVNGKLRGTIEAPAENDQQSVKDLVFSTDGVKKYTDGKTVLKEIYVKNKIYNIVVK